MTTDIFCFYLQDTLIQTIQTGGQQYSDTSPFSIPWVDIDMLVQGGQVYLAFPFSKASLPYHNHKYLRSTRTEVRRQWLSKWAQRRSA